METKIVRADYSFLPFIIELENICFEAFQRLSAKVIKNSIDSPLRDIYVSMVKEADTWKCTGAIIIRKYKRTVRIYSLAVLPEYRKTMQARKLIDYVQSIIKDKDYKCLCLEALASKNSLISWYESIGFKCVDFMEDYYGDGLDGFKLRIVYL